MADSTILRDADKTIRVLFEISNAVTNAVDLSGLYREIHLSLGKILNTDNIAIALYHEDKDALTFPYFVDEMDEDFGEITGISRKKSLAGTVIKKKTALLIRGDGSDHPNFPGGIIGTPSKVWMGAPLRIRDRILGVLVLQSYTDPHMYQESDLTILNTISEFIAMAIERKQAEEEIKESEKLTATLFKISTAVNTARDLNDLYRTIHTALNEIIDLTNFLIGLYSPREKTITFDYYVDEFDNLMGQSLPLSSGSIGRDVIFSGSPLFLRADAVDERMVKNKAVGAWPKTWLGVPLKVRDKVIGYMAAQSYSDPDLFTKKDVELFAAVSDQVALAIDRKRSQDEIRQSEKLTTALFNIANAVNTTDNLDDLYVSIHRSLEGVMDATNFAIGIYDRHTDTITYPYYVDETGETFDEIRDVSKAGIKAADVIRGKKPVFMTKEKTLARARATGKKIMGTVSEQWLGVPLKIQNHVRGVVVVQHYHDPDHYTQKDMDLLTAVSDQIALAIDRKQAQEETAAGERLTQTLFRISNAVNTTENLDELYISIFNTLNRLIALPNFYICLVDREKRKIHFPFYQDEYDSAHTISFTADYDPDGGGTITSDVINSKRPLFLTRDALREKGRQGRIVGQVPVVWIGVPLVVRERVIGVMAVQHYHDPSYFTRRDLALLLSVSEQVALAVDRKKAQEALLDHRANLEKRVAQRTRKLTEEIRERIQVEERLKKAKVQAEAAARAKLEFLTNMSHEIRTPINGIMGMTELALDRLPKGELSELLGVIDTEARQLLGIINDILDFSKIEAGKLRLTRTEFDLKQTFDQITAFLGAGIDPARIDFRSEIARDVPSRLTGDPGRLRQILMNLAGNAVKFTRRGHITMSCEKSGETPDGVELKFIITDTGIGIPEEQQARIFESFSQADGTTTRQYGGTGLGTTISKQLVELMGGRIGLESTPGEGSVFWFVIPFSVTDTGQAATCAEPAADEAPGPKAVPEKATPAAKTIPPRAQVILIAEDYPANQQIVQKYLNREGYGTILAENGRQAVDAFLAQRVDLILMDIQMPEMDGYEATRLIRESEADNGVPEASQTPIVAITAHAIEGYREKCLDAGMNDYLSKPFRRKELLDIVDRWTAPDNALSQETSGAEHPLAAPSPASGNDVLLFDHDLVMEEFDYDREFLDQVMTEFFNTVSAQLPVIRQAIMDQNYDIVKKEAHAIKGGAANLRANSLSHAAHTLEKIGSSKKLSRASDALNEVEDIFAALKTYVRTRTFS